MFNNWEKMKTDNSARDFSLDILRALSCLMVLGVHFVQRFPISGKIGQFLEKGSTGVGFFFIMSGYLAYKSLDAACKEGALNRDKIIRFWIKRAVHILPLYYILMIVYFLFFTAYGNVPKDSTGLYWFRYIFFINLWVPCENEFWVNLGAVWSISVFVLFYLLAPFIYRLIRKYYVALLCTALTYGLFKYTENIGTGRLPIRYLFYFMLGILVSLSIKEKKELEAIMLLSFILLFCFLTATGEAVTAPLLAALFILASNSREFAQVQHNIFGRAVMIVSKTSYSIYLIHAAVFTIMNSLLAEYNIIYMIVFIALTALFSWLSYYFVECKLARRLLNTRK